MATKNLASSVLEAGNNRASKIYRRIKTKKQRRETHQKIQNLVNHDVEDEDVYLDDDFSHTRNNRWGTVRLSPIRNFLRTKVGQKWSDVFSELTTKTMTVGNSAARDIKKYLLREVIDTPSGRDSKGVEINPESGTRSLPWRLYGLAKYYVDDNGLIQETKLGEDYYYRVTETDLTEAVKFLNNRAVAVKGNEFHWAYPKDGIYEFRVKLGNSWGESPMIAAYREEYDSYAKDDLTELKYNSRSDFGYPSQDKIVKAHWVEKTQLESFVARDAFTELDLEAWSKFPDKVKKLILDLGKNINF